ncbi:hypothetical protein [Lentzea cavernae]|uniref:hypothetical protein n=1 Tax=Lentzea cavernae TaxID=2020703 RepID=UPI00174D605A|nr:hypothetical protein [Lentzea cavernae]
MTAVRGSAQLQGLRVDLSLVGVRVTPLRQLLPNIEHSDATPLRILAFAQFGLAVVQSALAVVQPDLPSVQSTIADT